MTGVAERVFLGWEGAALDRSARWILDHHGEDLGAFLVALPGSRAARTLREKLALRAKPSWTPPRILTQGELIDEMVLTHRPVAGRLARTLAWARSLSELPRARLEHLAARPPEKSDLRGTLALAETVRALHAELAQEGLSFDRLAEGREARRFDVLFDAQRRWRAILDGLGLADPHESRFAAIDAGEIDAERRVLLVGVADMNRLLRQLVQRLGGRVTALVLAPETEADTFDELGCLRTEAWRDRDLELPPHRWHVVDGPEAQAERAIEILDALGGRFAAEDVTIGICDEEVAPHVERRLADEGIAAHHAAGTPLAQTRPHRLLEELAAWLARRAFGAYAALVRHPDFEAAVRARVDVDVASTLDGYHELHLPGVVDGNWLRGKDAAVRAVHAAVLGLLGDLASLEPRPLAEWIPPIRWFLGSIYSSPIDPSHEGERLLAAALSALSDALAEIEDLPGALAATPSSAAEAIELALASSGGASIPPRSPISGESAIELLGWLELPLDEANALVVTGFQEGFVPRSRRDDPFLPDRVRKKLGLPCAEDRIARDVYAASVLLKSKAAVVFVSGRRSRTGDPLLPSRLAFHVPKTELLARVAQWRRSSDGSRARAPRPDAKRSAYALPRIEPFPAVESMRVTAFGHYLRSPYAFYLEHVLGLESVDDAAREMDPLAFGSFAHAVLEAFGRSDLRDSTDEREIERWLRVEVESLAVARFGARPQPAVGLQLAQLAFRLAFFAREQAQRARDGWRIREVEWRPKERVELAMAPGEAPMRLRGTIDRIDVREQPGKSVEWAILDYKTGSSTKDPASAHRKRDGTWCELQLPLYTLLARELGLAGEPALGYFKIGMDEAGTGVAMAPWSALDIESALEAAREVVRCVRRGEFDDLGRFPDDPILLAIAGQGLLAGADEDDADESGEGEVA
ncbi:MAG TPA: PD-(D/E)XK nuclease family protein [Planctomycetota bacterium]|jgi:RecB family exonuclease|nr:PD-(D/E)XK nuclease family protein [Planctomycetota bacterium]